MAITDETTLISSRSIKWRAQPKLQIKTLRYECISVCIISIYVSSYLSYEVEIIHVCMQVCMSVSWFMYTMIWSLYHQYNYTCMYTVFLVVWIMFVCRYVSTGYVCEWVYLFNSLPTEELAYFYGNFLEIRAGRRAQFAFFVLGSHLCCRLALRTFFFLHGGGSLLEPGPRTCSWLAPTG